MPNIPAQVNIVLSAIAAGLFSGLAYVYFRRNQKGRALTTVIIATLNVLACVSFINEL